jgi:hypothetical protein
LSRQLLDVIMEFCWQILVASYLDKLDTKLRLRKNIRRNKLPPTQLPCDILISRSKTNE